jgi:hypothetical protein
MARGTTNIESVGTKQSEIEVKISNRIVELFSEGLYSSPNKAVEELVSNSFDAGARNVHVILPADVEERGSTVVVIDDGSGMDGSGLQQHWIIGSSKKRIRSIGNRTPIGKFGIGKLATYVLAKKLTHITKVKRRFYAATMDYGLIQDGSSGEVFSEETVHLPLRYLSEAQARSALAPWTVGVSAGHKALRLFGANAEQSWTAAIMSDLKPLASDIRLGQLRWILETAMPLRDDFRLFLNGERIKSSKLRLPRIAEWVLGKDLKKFPKLDDFKADKWIEHGQTFYGLKHPRLGRITGYAELYEGLLTTGKSSNIERSHGFFVYVRGRLINLTDEYFGIDRNLLRHGTFSRFRMIVHIDGLDTDLRSSREAIREGPRIEESRELLKAVFNLARVRLESFEERMDASDRLSTRVSDSPASLTVQPMVSLLSAAMEGRISPQYISFPAGLDEESREEYVTSFKMRVTQEDELVRGVALVDLGQEKGIAIYNTESSQLQINIVHPFVAYFLDDFENTKRNLPLDLIAMSEVLSEAHLHQTFGDQAAVRAAMSRRDSLLRYLARSSGKRNAFMIASDLLNASNNKTQLEQELVAAFNSMGFAAVPLGGPGKPDGIADAHLSAKQEGQRRTYRVSLEAKSKEKDGAKVSAKSVGVAGIARQRKDYDCDYAVVVGPDFPTTKDDRAALVKEIDHDKEQTGRSITLMRIIDLARLVQLVPLKRIGLETLRGLFENCRTPEEAKSFVDEIEARTVDQPPYDDVLEQIWELQKDAPDELVEYGAVVTGLRAKGKKNLTKADVIAICRALGQLAGTYIFAQSATVELTQKPDVVLQAIGAAIQQYKTNHLFGRQGAELEGQ